MAFSHTWLIYFMDEEDIVDRKRFEEGLISLGACWNGSIPEAVHLVDDTREVSPGDIFVLRQGSSPLTSEQAGSYCAQAASAGAAAVIADPAFSVECGVPVISLDSPHQKLQGLAEAFYGKPSLSLKVIAVTGTNGKTTTTYLIESLGKAMGLRVGVLGTISHRYPGYEEISANTTPGTLKLYRLMAGMVDAGCDLVAMEVSSHGIMQGRIDGVAFDAAVWNNLGTDHLDFHKTREAYALAKQRLFDHYLVQSHRAGKNPIAVANADDDEVVAHIHAARPENWGGRVCSFSLAGKHADIELIPQNWKDEAWQIEIIDHAHGKRCHTSLPLVGAYNVANAAGAMTAMMGLGYSLEELAEALSKIEQIPGRMQRISTKPTVIVDFAHTPEALENALMAARSCVPEGGHLCVVFGAGGDRDPSKRPMMGGIVAKMSDRCFVTSDNPRTEEPQAIIQGILEGMPQSGAIVSDVDRASAIRKAILTADEKDVIVVAGKGHEDYQILGKTKIHFDDREICRQVLAERLQGAL